MLSIARVLQFVVKQGSTTEKLAKMRAKGEPIDAFISCNSKYGSHITAVTIDPSKESKTLSEQLLRHVPEQVRHKFKELLSSEHEVPADLKFVLDKKELEVEMKARANSFTPDEVRRYISDKPSQGGGEGLPAWEDPVWGQLVDDLNANTDYLANDVELLPTPGRESENGGSDVDDEEVDDEDLK